MRPEFSARQVFYTVVSVSGDMINGTIIVRLLRRRDPGAVEDRRAHGALPTVEQLAEAIIEVINGRREPKDTVYVGGADYLSDRYAQRATGRQPNRSA